VERTALHNELPDATLGAVDRRVRPIHGCGLPGKTQGPSTALMTVFLGNSFSWMLAVSVLHWFWISYERTLVPVRVRWGYFAGGVQAGYLFRG
jgi:hypothetical protein